jgi:tetratricopeptide (TPR) repeat protein
MEVAADQIDDDIELETDDAADSLGFDRPPEGEVKPDSGDITADAAREFDNAQATPTGDAIAAAAEAEAHATVAPPAPPADAAGMEDELEEADFFISQNLVDEARGILDELLARHPGHPLVLAKLAELGGDADAKTEMTATPPEPPPPVVAAAAPPPKKKEEKKKPTVIAKPLGAEDAATHKDLGMAYKEMGLYDEAIKEFTLVRETPGLAVECHLLIGLCQMERGKFSEAITEFKSGLYVEGINDGQSHALYFEIGAAYEAISDTKEALYYFEKVAKKDPRFREVNKRIDGLKNKANGKGAKNGAAKPDAGGGGGHADSDAALDAVFDGTSEKDFG